MRLTEAQWKMMNVIWERHPASARDVLEKLEAETGWAYTTVKTMLDRLVEKGALSARLRANTTLYQPLINQQEARRTALRGLLDSAFEGAFGPLLHFMLSDEKLSKKEREELKRIIDDQKRRGGGK